MIYNPSREELMREKQEYELECARLREQLAEAQKQVGIRDRAIDRRDKAFERGIDFERARIVEILRPLLRKELEAAVEYNELYLVDDGVNGIIKAIKGE